MDTLSKMAHRKGGKDKGKKIDELLSKALEKGDKLISKASDWVNSLGGECYLMYGCNPCNIDMLKKLQPAFKWQEVDAVYPLRSGRWMRLHGEAAWNSNASWNMSVLGEGQKCYWHCPACVNQWSWKDLGGKRLLAIKLGSKDSGSSSDSGTVQWFHAYVGDELRRYVNGVLIDLDQWINVLKMCTLVAEVIEVGKFDEKQKTDEWFAQDPGTAMEILKCAIDNLNCVCERSMSSMGNVINLNASDYTQHDRYHARHLYCEDARLSIPVVGFQTKALVVRQKDNVVNLDFPDLYEILSYLSCVYDLSGFKGTEPAQKKAYNQIKSVMGHISIPAPDTTWSTLMA